MAIPPAMTEVLAEVKRSDVPGELAFEPLACVGAAFHSPTPLLMHQVPLPGGQTVTLCGTCRDNASVLTVLMQKAYSRTGDNTELSWPVRRSFGNRLRALLIPKEADG